MSKDDAVSFVKACEYFFFFNYTLDLSHSNKIALAEAIKWDGSSGGVIRMVILTKGNTERLIFYPDEYKSEYPNA